MTLIRRAAGVLAAIGLLLAAPLAHAQSAPVQQAQAEVWLKQAVERWGAIIGVTLHIATESNTDFDPAYSNDPSALRAKAARSRVEFEQALSAVRRDIDSAGPAPDLSALLGEDNAPVRAALNGVTEAQRKQLDRLAVMAALIEETRISMIDGKIEHDVAFNIILNATFCESSWTMAEAVTLSELEFAPGSFGALWWRLSGQSYRADAIDRSAAVAVLRARPQDVTQAQADLRAASAEMRVIAAQMREARLSAGPLIEGLVPAEEVEALARLRELIPRLPDLVVEHAAALDAYAETLPARTAQSVIGTNAATAPNIVLQLKELMEAPAPL